MKEGPLEGDQEAAVSMGRTEAFEDLGDDSGVLTEVKACFNEDLLVGGMRVNAGLETSGDESPNEADHIIFIF